MNQTVRDRVKMYQVLDEGEGSLFLWRPDDDFVLEDVQRAVHQGEGCLRGLTEFWLDYEDDDLSHPDDVFQYLFSVEVMKGENRPSSMGLELLEKMGACEVAICYRGEPHVRMVADPCRAARRYLGLSPQWRFGTDPEPS